MLPVVLVHGGWVGPWSWDLVASRLRDRRIATVVPRLPLTSLEDDVASVRSTLNGLAVPVVLCGHSYGGMVVTAAGEHPMVAHLVYLCAFMPDVDETVVDLMKGSPTRGLSKGITLTSNGFVLPNRGVLLERAYHDCDPILANREIDRMRPMAITCAVTPPRHAPWRRVRSTYALSEADRAVPPAIQQRMATRASTLVYLPTGHAPPMARPDLVAEILATIAARLV